ncbi:hypothetical protein BaRGS_00012298 [Batillaria attramentaria]|uniref:Apple domain-containing protein n=1 Tax=Batillaria attramentaria TaxID=370345 RepID=A0ABD0L9Y6_9CAEN
MQRQTRFKNLQFSDNVLWTSRDMTKLGCGDRCVRNNACVTFTYSYDGPHMTSCRLHATGMTSVSGNTSAAGTNLYLVTDPWRWDWSGSPCADNMDCPMTNSQCYSGRCLCTPGYFYSQSRFTCSSECSTLGTSFVDYRLLFIRSNNEENIANMTIPDCFQRCLTATSYTCRTIDYTHDNNQCNIASVTALDVPEYVHTKCISGCIRTHYQRTCL